MTRVADLFGISQPGVSTMIAALEHDVGMPLFVRRGTRLQPTPEAHLIYAEANRALEAVENTLRVASELRSGKWGQLAIAAYPSLSISLLPRLLSVFSAERPGMQMKIITRNSQSVKELIATHGFVFAVAELPVDYPVARMEIFSYRCDCMLPLGHPLAERTEITPADLDGVPFVTLFRGDPVYQQLAAAFSKFGVRWNVVAETEFFSTACELVAAGCGVGIIDPVVSAPCTQDVVRRPFRPAISYEIAILHPLHDEPSRLAQEFLPLLRQALAPHAG